MSVFLQGNTRLPQDGVLLNLVLYIREDVCTFMVISRQILLSMRKVVKKLKSNFMFNKFFFGESHAAYVITWKTVIQPERPQMIIQGVQLKSGPLTEP